MTTEQLKSEVERGNVDAIPQYALALSEERSKWMRECANAHTEKWGAYFDGREHTETLKASIRESLYYLRLGETGRATEILNQVLSA